MNALRNLWTAFANLAGALNALAELVNGTAVRLREHLDHEPTVPALPHEVIDNETASNGAGKRRKASV